jgi:serine/threonine-protein kinase
MGRYDVVGVLAKRRSLVGSMILIGTARNAPSPPDSSPRLGLSFSPLPATEATTTFQRPVAIKRIAPALARDAALVGSFLENARVVAGIRHDNIAQVHEVGHIGDEVFLVMDYLLGETAATLMRQLHSRGETLDFRLGAHIIAEASAGLEAAHSQGILHEQLTPHDLFIGYDGSVRVLDVGIAAARRRIAGELGGAGLELEYASPERCKKETLDRRSDVFSLGTMLWELTTGISPFERAKERDTIRAICEEPIVPPGSVLPGLPRQVSQITMQALARDKGKRYQTADALREALRGFVQKLDAGDPTEDLSQIMKRLFEARVGDKREMLRRIEAGKPITGLDIGEADEMGAAKEGTAKPITAKIPLARPRTSPMPIRIDGDGPPSSINSPARSNPPKSLDDDEPSVIITGVAGPQLPVTSVTPPARRMASSHPASKADPSTPGSSGHHRTPAAVVGDADATAAVVRSPAPRSSRFFLVITSAIALLLLGGVAFGLRNRDRSSADTVSAPTTPTSSPPLAVSMPTGAVVIAPSTVVSTATIPVPPASASTTAADDETVLHIDTVPSRATILIDGAKKGLSPLDLRLPKSGEAVMVEIRQKGYLPLKERVVPDVNQRLKLTLVAVKGPVTAPTGSAPYHKFE